MAAFPARAAVWLVLPLAMMRAAVAQQPFEIGGLYRHTELGGSGAAMKGSEMVVSANSGNTVFTQFDGTWAPDTILQIPLLGNSISFTVDLSRVGCACNLAVYLISMPARGVDGNPDPGSDNSDQPPYYCDANQVGGQWCPEIDIMEANNHAFAVTPHKCDAPTNGHYDNCDRGGCGSSSRDSPNAYGPGEGFTIDTMRAFAVRTEFLATGGEFSGMRSTLSQEGRELVLDLPSCEQWYFEQLTSALVAGMSLRITYWGGSAETMSWLDSPPCGQEACGDSAGDAVISNIYVGDYGDEEPSWATMLVRRFANRRVASWLPHQASATDSRTLCVALVGLALMLIAAVRAQRVRRSQPRYTMAASGFLPEVAESPAYCARMESGGFASPHRVLHRRALSTGSAKSDDELATPLGKTSGDK